jgi:thymidylate kinase
LSERLTLELPACADFHPVLASAFRAWDDAAIPWCLLRLPADLVAPPGDVDLLVDRAHLPRVRSILAAIDFMELTAGEDAGAVFISYHAESDCWIRLHIVTELEFASQGPIPAEVLASCLAARHRFAGVWRLSPEDECWITFLHCVFDKGAFPERHRARLQDHASRECPSGRVMEWLAQRLPEDAKPERLASLIAGGDFEGVLQLTPLLRAALNPRSWLGRRWRDVVRLPGRILRRLLRPGFSVAILGPDGAGKSTLAHGVAEAFFTPVKTIYMGFGVSGGDRQPLLARLNIPGVGAPGRIFVLWWQFLKAFTLRRRGQLVLFDRYTYDAFAPPPVKRSWLRRFASWVKAHSCPAPDLVVVLDAPGDSMFQRKGDLSAEVLEAQRQRFLALPKRLSNVLVLDAMQPPDAVRRNLTAHLWRLYQTRWGRRSSKLSPIPELVATTRTPLPRDTRLS